MSLYSMTGFAMVEGPLSDRVSAQIMVRSVNHRYRDIQLRFLGRDEGPELESRLRKKLESFAQRGRLSVQVELRWMQAPKTHVLVDTRACQKLMEELSVLGELRAGDILGIPGMVTVSTVMAELNPEESEALDRLVEEAGATFRRRRKEEADGLLIQIREDLVELHQFVNWIEPSLGDFRQRILSRLRERLEELMQDRLPDESRIVQEAAMLADRADVSEEVVRLKTHLSHFEDRLEEGGSVGRSLDFLCQELQREVNTLGTKCREMGVAERVVDAKAAIERIREQVQNLE